MDQMDRTRTDSDRAEDNGTDGEEERLRHEIEREKALYRTHYLSLKNIKVEIDHMKCLLKKNRKQIQLDFENWWRSEQSQLGQGSSAEERISSTQPIKAQVITGDAVADANIAEFYKMRDQILQKMQ